MIRFDRSPAFLVVLGSLAASCGLAGGQETLGGSVIPLVTPTPAYDTRAAERAACSFQAGKRTTETIGADVPHGDELPFKHVVLLMLENRSFDHYLAGLGGPAVEVDGVRLENYAGQVDAGGCDAARGHSVEQGHDCAGQTETDYNVDSWSNPATKIHRFHETRYCTMDTAHDWGHVHHQYNLADEDSDEGLMDGFVATNNAYGAGGGGGRTMGYYDQRDIAYDYWLANTFATSDRHFSSLLGPTWPNRYYYMSATSFGRTRTPDRPVVGGENLIELLKRNGRSAEVYRDGAVSFVAGAYGNPLYSGKSLWRDQNLVGGTTWEDLVEQNHLPDVSILDPSFSNAPWAANDEHPPHNVQYGQALVSRVVGKLMSNLDVWRSTVLIVTYDEHGGYYDHVEPPPACAPDSDPVNADFNRLGPRVPLYVISPWSKAHYMGHAVTDHTSVTRFVENRFDLPAMTRRDAAAWPLLDMFDFENPPFWTPPQHPTHLANIDPAPDAWCKANPPGTGVDPASAAEAGVTAVPVAPPNECRMPNGQTSTSGGMEREPNDGLHQLQHIDGAVTDADWFGHSWTALSATLAGSDDVDLFHYDTVDHVWANNEPTLRIVEAPAGVKACIFLACKHGTTIQTGAEGGQSGGDIDDAYCEGGEAKWAASGTIKGCCVTAGTAETQTRVLGYDCLGALDDDSADLVIKVFNQTESDPTTLDVQQRRAQEDRARMCLPYSLEFHF